MFNGDRVFLGDSVRIRDSVTNRYSKFVGDSVIFAAYKLIL